MSRPVDLSLVRVELTFKTAESPDAFADRIREAVAMIVGREALEDFRVRSTPLADKPEGLRPAD